MWLFVALWRHSSADRFDMIDRRRLIYMNIIEHKIRNLPDTRDLRLVGADRSPSQYRIVHGRIARVSFGSGLWSNGRIKSSNSMCCCEGNTAMHRLLLRVQGHQAP